MVRYNGSLRDYGLRVPFRIVEHFRPLRSRSGFWLVAGFAIFGLAFVVRYAADMVLESVPFITVFPAIVVAGWLVFFPAAAAHMGLELQNTVVACVLLGYGRGAALCHLRSG